MGTIEFTPSTGVIVTGGASGIGKASATALAQSGRPVAIWDLQTSAAESTAAELAATHGVATIGFGIDVTDRSRLAGAVDASRAALGSIGGLVHAAGAVRPGPIEALDETTWDFVIDVNLSAEAWIVQAILSDLVANPGSAIVGIASIEGLVGHGAIPSYCASKSGLLGLTRSLADALGPRGVRVNAVCPGYIETPMLAGALTNDAARAEMEGSSMLGRLGQPDDIAKPVRFLLSDQASFMTGTYLVVDGGTTSRD